MGSGLLALLQLFPRLLAIAGFSALAGDWPGYRADNARSGYADTELSLSPDLLWTHQADRPPSPAWPAPAKGSYWQQLEEIEPRIVDDRFYHPVIGNDQVLYSSSASDQVVCLDPGDGRVRWRFFTEGPVRYAPTLRGEQVLFGSDDGCVYCVNAASGELFWRRRIAPDNRRIAGNGRLISASPVRTGLVTTEGVVYATAGLYPSQTVATYALDIRSGDELWRSPLDYSPHGYLLASRDYLFVPTGRGTPVVLDLEHGRFVRQLDGVGGTYAVVTEAELIAGRGNDGTLTISAVGSRERLASVQAKHLVVSPELSFLADDTEIQAIDRKRHTALIRRIQALDQRLQALKRQRNDASNQGTAGVDLNVEITQSAQRLEKLRGDLPTCTVWRRPTAPVQGLIGCRQQLIAGGAGRVETYSIRDGRRIWSASTEGNAGGLATAEGRLVVTTDRGKIYCFGPANATPVARQSPVPVTEDARPETGPIGDFAKRALTATKRTKGFCLILGAGTGRLAEEIVSRSEFQVVVVERQADRVRDLREQFRAGGLYGPRLSVSLIAHDRLPFADHFANLILSEARLHDPMKPLWPPDEIQRVLHPFAGVAWLDPNGEPTVKQGNPGVGEWTHLYGNPANTCNSGDRRVSDRLNLQWFGGPGPRRMVDRHLRGPSPLCAGGVLVIPGENLLIGVDAYNGVELWQTDLPGSQRYSMPYDAGYLGMNDHRVYVAVRDQCWLIDATTGAITERLQVPAPGGESWRWGYAALVGDRLIGSWQRPSASRMKPTRSQIDLDYRDGQPLVCSEGLFQISPITGETRWRYRHGRILNPTMAIADGRLFFVESKNTAALANRSGRLGLADALSENCDVVAIDAETGGLLWRTPLPESLRACRNILYLLSSADKVVVAGSFLNDRNDSTYRIACLSATSGSLIWKAEHEKGKPGATFHGEQMHHPVVVGDRLVTEPVLYRLADGEPVRAGSTAKLWRLTRPGHSCGTISASADCIFFRAGNPTVLDLSASLEGVAAPLKLSPSRPGCWINIIPAGGLVLIPEASAGCVCHYSLQTSMAFIPTTP